MSKISFDNEYANWIGELKQRFRHAQVKAALKVNSELLLFNWQLGRDLVTKRVEERWGKGVVEQISRDLQQEFPGVKGFSARNLWFMKQWYSFYVFDNDAGMLLSEIGNKISVSKSILNQVGSEFSEPKLKQLVSETQFPPVFAFVPWRHHILIVQKCETIDEAIYYIKRTVEDNLSRSALEKCINADSYHTAGSAFTNYVKNLPDPQGQLAQALLKQNYDFSFMNLPCDYDEQSMEDAIEQRMTRFLLELGSGWAFVGRQKEIVIAGKRRKIDLLFYQIHLKCYVVMELKVRPFEPEFAGKLNFYVNAVNEYIREDSDNPTIGLLICKDLDRTEVQLSFQGITTPMGVATYENVRIKSIREHLPTTEQIKEQIELAEEEYKMNRKELDDRNENRE